MLSHTTRATTGAIGQHVPAKGDRVRLGSQFSLIDRVLWLLAWNPRPLWAIGGALAIFGAVAMQSPYGLVLGLLSVVIWWRAVSFANDTTGQLIVQAKDEAIRSGFGKLGVNQEGAEPHSVAVGDGRAPFGLQAKPHYQISVVYLCDAFFGVYTAQVDLPTGKLTLSESNEEVYFRHVTSVDVHAGKVEIALGKKTKSVLVGSGQDADAMVGSLRARLRPSSLSSSPNTPARHVDATDRVTSLATAETRQERRYCYLRESKLMEFYSDPTILAALIEQLQVPGTPATLKRLTVEEKRTAIETQIDHFRRTPTSFWFGAEPYEVLAASIWRNRGEELRRKTVEEKFCAVSREDDLRRPVAKWLAALGYETYMEIPLGRRRIDVLGRSHADALTAVELKNSDEEFKRALDQLNTFAEYAHRVYLACTPAFAAEYLEANAENRNVGRWDTTLLERKLQQNGIGLLIVERERVCEVIAPREQSPEAAKIGRALGVLSNFQRIEMD